MPYTATKVVLFALTRDRGKLYRRYVLMLKEVSLLIFVSVAFAGDHGHDQVLDAAAVEGVSLDHWQRLARKPLADRAFKTDGSVRCSDSGLRGASVSRR
jgi:hypothetical protein